AGTAGRVGQRHRDEVDALGRNTPVLLADAVAAAVQMRDAALVAFKLVVDTVDGEPAAADAIGAAPRCGAEIGGVPEIGRKLLEAEHERCIVTVEPQVLDDRAPGQDMGGQPTAGNENTLDRFARGQVAEDLVSCTHASVSFAIS